MIPEPPTWRANTAPAASSSTSGRCEVPDNPTSVDESTDAWDTIDWLVKKVKQCNGRIAMIGGSYDGMTVAIALAHPHPALAAAIAATPVINTSGWVMTISTVAPCA